jgi:hypothetical protein
MDSTPFRSKATDRKPEPELNPIWRFPGCLTVTWAFDIIERARIFATG